MTKHEIAVEWLVANRPGSHWALNGDFYSNFLWLDDPATKPLQSDLGLD